MSDSHSSKTIQRIPFHGGDVLVAEIDGTPHVLLKPAIESLGIDYDTQSRKLNRKSWATKGLVPSVAEDGKTRNMVTVDVRTFLMLLATIDESRVSDTARPVLVAYQSEIANVIEAYFTKGAVINPRADEHQINAMIFQSRSQLEMLQAAKGLIHSDHLEARARVVVARGMGEHAELDPGTRPLYTQDFLKSKKLTRKRMTSTAGVFGKRVKKAYTEQHGRPPHQYPLDLSNGQTRNVNAYTEADRPLMEQVWDQHYAVGTQGVLA